MSTTAARERARGLLAAEPVERDGYLDVLPDAPRAARTPAQRLMLSRALPLIYERLWRPLGGAIGLGVFGPSASDEHEIALGMLALAPGETVLDVACGPGNFTRGFADAVGRDGLALGIDASPTMLARAVADTDGRSHPAAAYVRGDAEALPFADASVDAVCCFAALYLIEDPQAALAECVRVLAPGGRLAVMTTCRLRSLPGRAFDHAVEATSTITFFERDAITGPLEAAGMRDVVQHVTGLAQFVSAQR